ncbi:hypothetical protein PFISCL1PPCAC_17527, partial [Pristionchus fissidentatus]
MTSRGSPFSYDRFKASLERSIEFAEGIDGSPGAQLRSLLDALGEMTTGFHSNWTGVWEELEKDRVSEQQERIYQSILSLRECSRHFVDFFQSQRRTQAFRFQGAKVDMVSCIYRPTYSRPETRFVPAYLASPIPAGKLENQVYCSSP